MRFSRIILLLASILSLSACSKLDDDRDLFCKQNCNLFKGRVMTVDSIGIPNVKLSLDYTHRTTLTSYQRLIGEATTDANGYYEISAYIKDREINDRIGSFKLSFNPAVINTSLSDHYLAPSVAVIGDPFIHLDVSSRNATSTNDFIIPKKGTLEVQLKNFEPVQEGDYFKANVDFNYDFFSKQWSFFQNKNELIATGNTSSKTFQVILNGTVVVFIEKMKNGVYEKSSTFHEIKNPNIYPLEFAY